MPVEIVGVTSSIIASLIVDSAKLLNKKINQNTFDSLYAKALKKCAKEYKKEKEIKDCFESKTFADKVFAFRERGELISHTFYVELFHPVLGGAAETFVNAFLAQVRQDIAQDEKLSHEYQIILEEDNNRLLRLQMEKETIYESAGLTRIPILPSDFVEPTETLNKIKSALKKQNACLLYGLAGSGKSIAAAALAHETESDIFWLEFQPHKADAKLVELDVQRHLRRDQADTRSIWELLEETDAALIFDNLHYIKDEKTLSLLHAIANVVTRSAHQSRIIFTSRERAVLGSIPQMSSINIEGLAVGETKTLLQEKWQLHLPSQLAQLALDTFHGHPQYLLFFHQWLENAKPSEEEIKAYFNSAATKKDDDLYNHLAEELYNALGPESNANKLLKAVAFWRLAESSDFIEHLYDEFNGEAFQDTLSDLCRDKGLVQQAQDNTYNVHDILRQFYYLRTDKRTPLHEKAADLYNQRLQNKPELVTHLEAAHHFRKAELFEQSAEILLPITYFCTTHGYFWQELKHHFNRLSIDSFTDDRLRARCYNALAGLLSKTGEWDKAVEFYNKALTDLEKVGDIHGMAQTYGNIGMMALQQQKAGTALSLFTSILFLFIKLGAQPQIEQTNRLIAQVAQTMDETEFNKELAEIYATLQKEGVKLGTTSVVSSDEVKDILPQMHNQNE